MKLKKEEDTLLEIKQIQDIESIQLKDIYLSMVNGKRFLVPGFIVTYGEPSKIIFLTTQDKYFEEFVRRIKEVYLEEKDQVIREGIMGKEYIQIDPLSKNILLNGNLEQLDALYRYYDGKEGYEESLLMEEDRVKASFPIIEYHLQETAKRFGITIGKTTLSSGRNGVYYITTMIGQKPTILPIYYEETPSNWKVEVGNVLEDAIPLYIETTFTKEGVNVHCTIPDYDYSDYTSYMVKHEKMMKSREVYFKDQLVYWKEEDLPRTEKPDASKWVSFEEEKQLDWYLLPWNSYYGVKIEDKCLEEDGRLTDRIGEDRIISSNIIYLSPTEKSILIKDFATKRYYKKKDDRIISQNVLLDRIRKTVIGTIQKENVLLETSFQEEGVNGYYKAHLQGKHFYQISDKENTKRYFVGRQDGVEEASDLIGSKVYQKENQ